MQPFIHLDGKILNSAGTEIPAAEVNDLLHLLDEERRAFASMGRLDLMAVAVWRGTSLIQAKQDQRRALERAATP